jgi:hypothetical protein
MWTIVGIIESVGGYLFGWGISVTFSGAALVSVAAFSALVALVVLIW